MDGWMGSHVEGRSSLVKLLGSKEKKRTVPQAEDVKLAGGNGDEIHSQQSHSVLAFCLSTFFLTLLRTHLTSHSMASANPFDLLNDDAQDQEIQIPAVKKETKPVAKTASTPAASKAADNKGPRKDGARPNTKPRESDNNNDGKGPSLNPHIQ